MLKYCCHETTAQNTNIKTPDQLLSFMHLFIIIYYYEDHSTHICLIMKVKVKTQNVSVYYHCSDYHQSFTAQQGQIRGFNESILKCTEEKKLCILPTPEEPMPVNSKKVIFTE